MEINVGELRPGQLTQFRFWATDWRNVRRCRLPEAMSSRPSKGSYQLPSANEANDKGSGDAGLFGAEDNFVVRLKRNNEGHQLALQSPSPAVL